MKELTSGKKNKTLSHNYVLECIKVCSGYQSTYHDCITWTTAYYSIKIDN